MSEMENMKVFADQLWQYMVPKLDSKFSSNVSYFRAQVVTNLGNNVLEVQRPLENGTLTLPCVDSVAHAQPGQQVVALAMGSMSNAIVVGDGMLNVPVSAYGPASTVTLEAGKGGMPFNRLVSNITAVQGGSGEPSPENVRLINGFTGMNLHLNDTVIAVDWQTEAGTVYGGTLDVLKGTLTVSHNLITLTGQETNWTKYGANTVYIPASSGLLGDAEESQPGTGNSITGSCSICPSEAAGYIYRGYVEKASQSGGVQFNNIQARWGLASGFTVSDWKARLQELSVAGTPVQILYKLASPITYQLTQEIVATLAGQNTIWSDTGDVTVEYGRFVQAMQQEIENME